MSTDGRQRKRILAGGLIIAALVGSGMLIFFLDSILQMFVRRYTIVAVVPNAPNIIDGTPVWIGGKEVGLVTKIAFLPQRNDTLANVALTLELPHSLASQVREDSRVRLTSARLIGAKVIDIEPGTPAARALAEGDTLRPETPLTAAAIMARAATVRAAMAEVTAEVQRIAPQLTARMADTRRAFSGMQLAMAEAGQISQQMQSGDGIARLRNPAFTASLQRAQAHVAAMPRLIGQMRQRSADAAEVGAALSRLQLRADSLNAQLAAISVRVENGTLARLQQDTALVRAMHAARAELDSLIAEARRKPLRFVF